MISASFLEEFPMQATNGPLKSTNSTLKLKDYPKQHFPCRIQESHSGASPRKNPFISLEVSSKNH